jgi:hypothetical protein
MLIGRFFYSVSTILLTNRVLPEEEADCCVLNDGVRKEVSTIPSSLLCSRGDLGSRRDRLALRSTRARCWSLGSFAVPQPLARISTRIRTKKHHTQRWLRDQSYP